MKTRKERKTLKRERSQVKRGLMRKQSTPETKRGSGEHFHTFEGLYLEFGV
jgi:hypothetical protein